MRAGLISLGSISSRWLIDAMKKRFDVVDHIDIQDLEVSLGQKKAQVMYKGKPLPKYDCIYARGSFRYAVLLRAITTLLQAETYSPLRTSSFTIGHDKILSHLKFQEYGVPQPTTYIAATADAGKKIAKKIPFPVIMKLPAGTHGKGVMLADSPEGASSMIDALAMLKQPFLMQEFIDTDGRDLRLIVVGDKIAAAMRRVAAKGEQRANIHSGGHGEKVLVDDKTRKAAILAARATGCEICAVDVLPSIKGPLVLEVNLSPGLQGITKCTKIDVADIIAEFLFAKTKEFRERGKEEILKELGAEHEILGPLDFRGNRILLPEVVSMASKIKEREEVNIKVKKGFVEITKVEKEKK
ncbi:RimK family alpha-L-glutamate ligase [Candidatus Woesearchaeota archaeon]|nr:RimK family alpha-L-glutamate ligase [Candidatus Woesearchaeota archaeon]MBW3015979.1 RimK family alpha-L-glutamate ligase [Candidatus Woesearchaeota archaeon]